MFSHNTACANSPHTHTSEAGDRWSPVSTVSSLHLLVSDLRPWDPECSDTDSDIYKRHNISIHHHCHVSGSERGGDFQNLLRDGPRLRSAGCWAAGWGGTASVIVKYLYQPKSLNLGARHYLGPTCVLHIKYLYMQQGQSRLQKEINLFGVNIATRIRASADIKVWHFLAMHWQQPHSQLVFCRK